MFYSFNIFQSFTLFYVRQGFIHLFWDIMKHFHNILNAFHRPYKAFSKAVYTHSNIFNHMAKSQNSPNHRKMSKTKENEQKQQKNRKQTGPLKTVKPFEND